MDLNFENYPCMLRARPGFLGCEVEALPSGVEGFRGFEVLGFRVKGFRGCVQV